MSVAAVYELPVARRPLEPPRPPRAPEHMSFFGWVRALQSSALGAWGQSAYEEDIIKGRFFGRSSFTVNTPDAIRHVLVDNYENYTRTPAGLRVLRPILGKGLLIAEGKAWKHQRRTLAPAFTPRAVTPLVPHMVAVTDETIATLHESCDRPVDLREMMQRMTLEIAGRTMFSFGMDRHGAAFGVADPAGFRPRTLSQAMDGFRRDADGRTPGRRQEGWRPAARSVRPDGRRARSRDRPCLQRRTAWRRGGDDDSRRPRDDRDHAILGAVSAGARSRHPGQGGRRGEGPAHGRSAPCRAADVYPRGDRRDHAALSAGLPDRTRRQGGRHHRRACRQTQGRDPDRALAVAPP